MAVSSDSLRGGLKHWHKWAAAKTEESAVWILQSRRQGEGHQGKVGITCTAFEASSNVMLYFSMRKTS